MSERDLRDGDKVVCIDASGTTTDGVPDVRQGEVYTIRWFGPWSCGVLFEGERPCVRLAEFNPRDPYDVPFFASRFRPVQRRQLKTSIEARRELPTRHTVKPLAPVEV